MKIGVLTSLFGGLPFEEALDLVKDAGVEAIELSCANPTSTSHCNPELLLNDEAALRRFRTAIESRGLFISALSCHGNPVHPNRQIADLSIQRSMRTIELAERLGIDCVCGFSGCPGDSDTGRHPNWVTCPWPTEFSELLTWQWNEKVIPFWKEAVAFAAKHGVTKIALEMHPGFVVYNPETLLRLRAACGEAIGANLDLSHLFWQGIEPIHAIRALEGAIYHFHAKDTRVDPINTATNGCLDTKPYRDEIHRSWVFRTMGYGHPAPVWKDVVSNLRMVGYDYVLSIEHEDSLMSGAEGLRKAVAFLKDVVITEKAGQMWWA